MSQLYNLMMVLPLTLLQNKDTDFTACSMLQVGVYQCWILSYGNLQSFCNSKATSCFLDFFFIFIAKCHLFKALFIPISLQTFPVFLWTFYIQNMFQVFFFVFLHFILFFHSWTMYISAKKVCLTHSYTNWISLTAAYLYLQHCWSSISCLGSKKNKHKKDHHFP